MIPKDFFETIRFESPALLWLLTIPAALFVLWCWRVARRRADARRLVAARVLPVRERYNFAGDLTFWLATLLAAALCIVAIAKPQARIALSRRASADVVILQDASASMYVTDTRPDPFKSAECPVNTTCANSMRKSISISIRSRAPRRHYPTK